MGVEGPSRDANSAPAGGSAAAEPQAWGGHTTLLIAALGGQGGAVLTDWIVQAARAERSIVQATSTPGVSQRTGATTYYVEIAAAPAPGAAPPVLGLAPIPGRVDVLVCAELLEAARMLERGMSTPSRTTVVASTHRVYTTREKMSGGDARFDSARIADAVAALSRRAALFDMDAIRARHRSVISAVLFGALAGGGALPIGRAACEAAIRGGGRGVESSLAAFDEAFGRARAAASAPSGRSPASRDATDDAAQACAPLPPPIARSLAALPDRVAAIVRHGAAELVAYQDAEYAMQYLGRVARLVIAEERAQPAGAAHDVSREAARFLALWMRYDDLIRVASVKARASRLARIRAEAGADAGAVVRVHDFFKPGALELAAILPRRAGEWLERRASAARAEAPAGGRSAAPARGRGIALQTSSATGMLALRLAAALRPLRRHSLRYAREQRAIEDWLGALEEALAGGAAERTAALDLARLPRLIRGYGDTHATGRASFERLLAAWRAQRVADAARAGAALREGALAALNDSACGTRAPAGAAAPGRSAAASSRS
ncbi:MAG TPA: indolepyruvate oxidoreductase subunit beta family protein [Casimicrobiaceae bacterium]